MVCSKSISLDDIVCTHALSDQAEHSYRRYEEDQVVELSIYDEHERAASDRAAAYGISGVLVLLCFGTCLDKETAQIR